MRTRMWLVVSIIVAVCVAAPTWAGVPMGIVSGLTGGPTAGGLQVTMLHTIKRWDGGTIDPNGLMKLQFRQTFAVEEATGPGGRHILLAIPSLCLSTSVSLQVRGVKVTPTACSAAEVTALAAWLQTLRPKGVVKPPQVRFMRAPLRTQLAAGDTISLELTCRIKPRRDGTALLFAVPQILHRLEPNPIGELEYQLDVGPAQSVSVPGYEQCVRIEENTPNENWRRIHYGAQNVATGGLSDFIVRIIR